MSMLLGCGRDGKEHHPPASSGYPDASNTGIPVGTSLKLHNTDFTTSSNGQLVDALDIRGSLIINHTGVTVTRCRVSEWSVFGMLCESPHTVTITDSHIEGGVNPGTCVYNSGYTFLRCDIEGAENGFDIGGDVTIEDCFIHDLYNEGVDAHADGIQIEDGADNITIRHNTILSRGADDSDTTSAIISPQASSGVSNWLIHNNAMAGGASTLYGPQNGTGTNITITDNKFWDLYFPLSGSSGFFYSWTEASDESTISGNQLGRFSGGYDTSNKLILGTWSGTAF
jgi:hypothetical protein